MQHGLVVVGWSWGGRGGMNRSCAKRKSKGKGNREGEWEEDEHEEHDNKEIHQGEAERGKGGEEGKEVWDA